MREKGEAMRYRGSCVYTNVVTGGLGLREGVGALELQKGVVVLVGNLACTGIINKF